MKLPKLIRPQETGCGNGVSRNVSVPASVQRPVLLVAPAPPTSSREPPSTACWARLNGH